MKNNQLAILLAIGLFISSQSFSNDFIIKNFIEAPNDLTARTQKKFTVNDEPCALLKIRSDIQGVKFDTRNGITSMQYVNGEYLVYISPGERILYFMKDGFLKKEYRLPVTIKELTVYKLELTGSDVYPIVINTDPRNIDILLDGKPVKSGTTIPDVAPGSHTLNIEYPGYGEVHETIYVSKNKISFNYTLEALKQIPVRINTKPEGASIMVNNRTEGSSPTDVFIFPGKSHILITKDLYQVIDTTVKVTKDTKTLEFTLQSITGSYDISSNTPDIKLLIDNKPAKLAPTIISEGRHTLSATSEGYYSYDTIFTLTRGESFIKQINLKRMTGDLQVTVKPFETECKLIKESYNPYNGKTTEEVIQTWTGSQLVENIPTGKYIIRASKPGFTTGNKNVTIENNKTTEEDLTLLIISKEPGSKSKAIAFSALMPGAGQLYSQQKRGWLYMPLFVGTLGTSYIFHTDVKKYNDARDAYLNATTDIQSYREKMDATYDKAVQSAKTRNLLVYTAGAVYLTSLVDAFIFGGREVTQQAGIGKYLNKINLTCVPVDGIPTYGFSYKF